MKYHYTLFIDEAGDDKVGSLKPEDPNGNSEWLSLGGYLVRADQEPELESRRDQILKGIGGRHGQELHYRNYTPANRLKICTSLAEFSARAFVVCSFKRTMLGHHNPRAKAAGTSSSNNQYLFNFVARLLLERVTEYVAWHGSKSSILNPKMKIVMATRRGHHFGHFKAYTHQLINQAKAGLTHLDTKVIVPEVLSYGLVYSDKASKNAGLQLADATVSAVFQSIEQASPAYGDRPAEALKRIMAGRLKRTKESQDKSNFGLTLYPAREAANQITDGQKEFFSHFGYSFDAQKK